MIPSEMGMFVVAPAHHHDSYSLILDGGGGGGGGRNNAATAALGVIPLLTPGPCLNMVGSGGETGNVMGGYGHDFYPSRNRMSALQQQMGFSKKSIDLPNLLESASSGCSITCQDCGNQAKKDCNHRRCRTCCRSRGFDCSTHVKSTWVPAARRRERQIIAAPVIAAETHDGGGGVKKPRLVSSHNTTTTSHTSASNTPPPSSETSSSHQDASFKESLPGQVRAPAVFKCVRVTPVEDGDDEFVYQAVVKIGGHVFKGFLYGHGVEPKQGSFPNFSDLHLGGGSGGVSTSSPLLDPSSDVYGGSGGGGLLGGPSYGNSRN